jgi:hypothetical protein
VESVDSRGDLEDDGARRRAGAAGCDRSDCQHVRGADRRASEGAEEATRTEGHLVNTVLTFTTTAVDAFRAALALKSPDERNPILHVPLKQGHANELFTTDNHAIVFVPIQTEKTPWTNDAPASITIELTNTKIPARAHTLTLTIQTNDTTTNGVLLADGQPAGIATITNHPTPTARRVAPAELPPLPVAPPYGYDTLHAADILRASKPKTPPRHDPIELPQAGYAFRWEFNTGGSLILVANRASDEERNAFRNTLRIIREQTNP